jgi:hypothetical protein
MRALLFIIAGLALLIVLLLGGGIAWVTNTVTTTKVDVQDQKAVETFRSVFEKTCTKAATQQLNNPDYQEVALVKQVCACNGKAALAYMKKNKGKTVIEVQAAVLRQDPVLVREFDACAAAYGLNVDPY